MTDFNAMMAILLAGLVLILLAHWLSDVILSRRQARLSRKALAAELWLDDRKRR